MATIEVRPITLPQDTMRFLKSWWPIYEGDEHWVPPLLFERKAFFNPAKNPYFKVADIQCFMAYRDGEAVGTISAQVDHAYQEVEEHVGFFGFFEFVDDPAVARALLDAACDWLRERGMKRLMGPFNFNTNHEFGLLCEGFDTDPCIANPHNRDYYERIYQAIGLEKSKDWYAYWVDRAPVPERIAKISERLMKRYPNVELRKADMKHFDREVGFFHEIYNDAWEGNWAHSRLSEEEFLTLANGFKAILDPNLVWLAFVDGEPAALTVTLPDYNQVVKHMNGRLFPFGWTQLLFPSRRIDAIRVFILGVKHKFQGIPLGAPLYIKTWEEALKNPKIRGAEASLVVEDNYRMRGALEKLGFRIYKTYRIYGRDLA